MRSRVKLVPITHYEFKKSQTHFSQSGVSTELKFEYTYDLSQVQERDIDVPLTLLRLVGLLFRCLLVLLAGALIWVMVAFMAYNLFPYEEGFWLTVDALAGIVLLIAVTVLSVRWCRACMKDALIEAAEETSKREGLFSHKTVCVDYDNYGRGIPKRDVRDGWIKVVKLDEWEEFVDSLKKKGL